MRGTDDFIRAAHYNEGREALIQFVWHSAETNEYGGVARAVANYFTQANSGGSTNVCVDNIECIGSVEWEDTPWSSGVSEVDRRAGSAELAGRASQSEGEWLDEFGVAMLDRAARMYAEVMVPEGAAIRWLTHDEIRNRVPGMMCHADVTYAYGISGGHTDPGDGFPWGWLEDRIRSIAGGDRSVPPPPPPPAPNSNHPTIHFGMIGESVSEWQGRIGGLVCDGVFGPKTLQATKNWQSFFGLVPDGIVGPLTWGMSDYLEANKPSEPAPPVVDFSGYNVIQMGSTGSTVAQWQALLNQFAGQQLVVDGIFGPRTGNATRAFQSVMHCVQDGIVGPQTWGAMAYIASGG
jgi:hypothetical protein